MGRNQKDLTIKADNINNGDDEWDNLSELEVITDETNIENTDDQMFFIVGGPGNYHLATFNEDGTTRIINSDDQLDFASTNRSYIEAETEETNELADLASAFVSTSPSKVAYNCLFDEQLLGDIALAGKLCIIM